MEISNHIKLLTSSALLGKLSCDIVCLLVCSQARCQITHSLHIPASARLSHTQVRHQITITKIITSSKFTNFVSLAAAVELGNSHSITDLEALDSTLFHSKVELYNCVLLCTADAMPLSAQ